MKFFLLIILIFTISCATKNEEIVWNYLKKEGLTDAGAAGLMGNLKAESNMQSVIYENSYKSQLCLTDQEYVDLVNNGTYQNFTTDKIGFGLAQWTYHTRKKALLESCQNYIGDLECQLRYLMYELVKDYAPILKVLKSSTDVYECTIKFMIEFENPADQSESKKNYRYQLSQNYYNEFKDSYTIDAGKKSILTSFIACDKANNDECSKVIVKEYEFRNWRCQNFKNYCSYVPINQINRKIFERLVEGEDKEIAAKNYEKFLSNSYGTFSVEDTRIINKKNSCSYISFGSFQESKSRNKYLGISDKNLCFNADQFSDLKGLVNCGYAEVLLKYKGQSKTINLCSYVPTNEINQDLLPYFKYRFIDKITLDDLEEIIEDGLLGRRLDEEISYEISIEDKNGKIVKFTDINFEGQIISEGKDEDRKEESLEENISKIIIFHKCLLLLIFLAL